jgi:hypothetical protein
VNPFDSQKVETVLGKTRPPAIAGRCADAESIVPAPELRHSLQLAPVSAQVPDQRTKSASAEVSSEDINRYAEFSPVEVKQEAKQDGRRPAQAVAAVSPAASEPRATAVETVRRPHLRRQTVVPRRALALCTIEFPDGRRVNPIASLSQARARAGFWAG